MPVLQVEGVTEKVISEQRSKVVRACAVWASGESLPGRGNKWKDPEAGRTLPGPLRNGRKVLVAGEEGPRGQLLGAGGREVGCVDFHSSESDGETLSTGMI